MVIPGLSGDEKEQYCISAAGACLKRDLDCVVVNYRGMSGVTLKVSICFSNLIFHSEC
jgi:predicted alpha/beta-fold hydrolase